MKTIRRLPRYYRKLGFVGLCKFIFLIPLGIVVKRVQQWIDRTEKRIISVTVPGIKHPVYVRVGTADMWVVQEILLDEEYNCELPMEPKVIVDAGANIGTTAIYFANKHPSATIIAIEPEHSNFEMLKRNTKPYQNIQLLKAALWSENKQLNLLSDGCHVGFFVQDDVGGDTRAVTLETLMKQHGLERIDILKMDIEGAEKEVLEHSSEWIDKVSVLMVGLHDYLKPGCSAALFAATKNLETRTRAGRDTTFVWILPKPKSAETGAQVQT